MPLTDEEVIAHHFDIAMKQSDKALERHWSYDKTGDVIAGSDSFGWVCSQVLKLRKLKAEVAKLENYIKQKMTPKIAPTYYHSKDGTFERYSTPNGLEKEHALQLERELRTKKLFAITRHYYGKWYVYRLR